MKHILKIDARHAERKQAGEKTFEIRKNDRNYQVGDTVVYNVIETREDGTFSYIHDHKFNGTEYIITYILTDVPGLKKGYCIFADIKSTGRR